MNCRNCGHFVAISDVPYPRPVVFCDQLCLDIYVDAKAAEAASWVGH